MIYIYKHNIYLYFVLYFTIKNKLFFENSSQITPKCFCIIIKWMHKYKNLSFHQSIFDNFCGNAVHIQLILCGWFQIKKKKGEKEKKYSSKSLVNGPLIKLFFFCCLSATLEMSKFHWRPTKLLFHALLKFTFNADRYIFWRRESIMQGMLINGSLLFNIMNDRKDNSNLINETFKWEINPPRLIIKF